MGPEILGNRKDAIIQKRNERRKGLVGLWNAASSEVTEVAPINDTAFDANRVEIMHQTLTHGDRCQECGWGNVYGQKDPRVLVCVTGQAPLAATGLAPTATSGGGYHAQCVPPLLPGTSRMR